MLIEIDHGIRCDKHVGEVFAVRCFACDAATAEHFLDIEAERHQRALDRQLALSTREDPK